MFKMDKDDIKYSESTDLEQEEESKIKKAIRRVFITTLALILLVMILTYFLGFEVYPYLRGKAVSERINEDYEVLLKNGGRIIFNPDVYAQLKSLYLGQQQHEIKVCLEGEKRGDNYYINSLRVPEISSQSVVHVSAELCDKKTIIPLHSHPYKSCLFSEQDINSYEAVKRINPNAIIGLMCEIDGFSFYWG